MSSGPSTALLMIQKDLVPVNAVIGFLKPDGHWPPVLYDLGYRLSAIEQPVRVTENGILEVDVIGHSRRRNHGLLIEGKSGANADAPQAGKYAKASAEDVQRTGSVSFRTPATATVEPVYVCLEEDSARIITGVSKSAPGTPVVAMGSRAVLAYGKFHDGDLTAVFSEGVGLPPLEEVPRYHVASQNTPKWDIARGVFATVVAHLRRGQAAVPVSEIAEETFPMWNVMGTDLRRYLGASVRNILAELSKHELSGLIRLDSSGPVARAELLLDAESLRGDPNVRTRRFQRLAKIGSDYIQRLKERKGFEEFQRSQNYELFPEDEAGNG